MTIIVKRPEDCVADDLTAFESLVVQGSEVEQNRLKDRIREAFLLGFGTEDKELVAVAGIKSPSRAHIRDVFDRSNCGLFPNDWLLEYGWAFTKPSHRRHGLGAALFKMLLSNCADRPLWATTRKRNQDVHGILERHGFQRTGRPFPGRKEDLILWTRLGSKKGRR